MSKLLDILPIATEKQVRARNASLKKEPNTEIKAFLVNNAKLQELAMAKNFDPSPVAVKYNLDYKWTEIVNNITSTIFKNRPGRSLKYSIVDKNYGFIYGLLSFASPILNSKLSKYVKQETGKEKVDFKFLNNSVIDMNVCIGTGPLTRYLTGKMQVYMALSNYIKKTFDTKYNTNIQYVFTTSLYGKSSIYNRIKQFKYLGLSKGYNALFTEKEIAWIKKEYKKIYPNRVKNKSAKAPHLMRLYEHLWNHYKDSMPFFPLKTERGVYLYDSNKYPYNNIEENISYWKERWYYPRKKRLENRKEGNNE